MTARSSEKDGRLQTQEKDMICSERPVFARNYLETNWTGQTRETGRRGTVASSRASCACSRISARRAVSLTQVFVALLGLLLHASTGTAPERFKAERQLYVTSVLTLSNSEFGSHIVFVAFL